VGRAFIVGKTSLIGGKAKRRGRPSQETAKFASRAMHSSTCQPSSANEGREGGRGKKKKGSFFSFLFCHRVWEREKKPIFPCTSLIPCGAGWWKREKKGTLSTSPNTAPLTKTLRKKWGKKKTAAGGAGVKKKKKFPLHFPFSRAKPYRGKGENRIFTWKLDASSPLAWRKKKKEPAFEFQETFQLSSKERNREAPSRFPVSSRKRGKKKKETVSVASSVFFLNGVQFLSKPRCLVNETFDFSNFTLDNIDKVEVVRGAEEKEKKKRGKKVPQISLYSSPKASAFATAAGGGGEGEKGRKKKREKGI